MQFGLSRAFSNSLNLAIRRQVNSSRQRIWLLTSPVLPLWSLEQIQALEKKRLCRSPKEVRLFTWFAAIEREVKLHSLKLKRSQKTINSTY